MKLFVFMSMLLCKTVGCIETNLGYAANDSESYKDGVDRPNEFVVFSISVSSPSHRVATIRYTVEVESHVKLEIYDAVRGQRIIELINETHLPGDYIIRWNGTSFHNVSVPSNTYVLMYEVTGQDDTGQRSRLVFGKKSFKYFG